MNIRRFQLPRATPPVEGWPLIGLLAAFLIFGTFQHDPWKSEDAAHFGIVWRAVQSGDWLYFHLSNSTQAEPPLYYWLSGIFTRIFGDMIGAANAARMATTLLAGISLGALYGAARNFFGKELATAAPLTLVACLGFLVASHDTQPLTATIAGLSLLLLGFSQIRGPLWIAGLVTSCGIAFILLSSGLRFAPALALLTTFFIAHPERVRLFKTIAIAAILGGAAFGIWVALFAAHPSAEFPNWMTQQLRLATLNGFAPNKEVFVTASWFTWPAWPLAALALWTYRHRRTDPGMLISTGISALILLTLFLSGEDGRIWICAALPGLCLLAPQGIRAMRRGVESLLDWFGRMTFALFLIFLWAGWSAMTFGYPVKWAKKSAILAPGYSGDFNIFAFMIAAAATLTWIWIMFTSPRSPLKGLFSLSGGMVLFWIVITTLWLPWLEHQRSYRSVATGLIQEIREPDACIITNRMGEAQFASFDLFLTPKLKRTTTPPPTDTPCRYLLQQGNKDEIPPGSMWNKVWEGQRPGDKTERYRLYTR